MKEPLRSYSTMRYLKKTIQFIALLFVAFLINSFAVEHLRAIDPPEDREQQMEPKQVLPQGYHLMNSILNPHLHPAIRGAAIQNSSNIDECVDSVQELMNPEAGKSKKVSFCLPADNLQFYNRDTEYVTDLGKFQLFAGPKSQELQVVEVPLE